MQLDYYESLWRESRFSPPEEKEQTYWEKTASFIHTASQSSSLQEKATTTLNFLTEKEILFPGASILDIGCGSGLHALAFAQKSTDVVGVDIAANAIAYARKQALYRPETKLHFLQADWNTIDLDEKGWRNKFDLVFASLSPAIYDLRTLKKMIEASRGYCFYAYPVKKLTGLCDDLAKCLHTTQKEVLDPGESAYCLYNLTYLLGYYPEIQYEDLNWKIRISLDQAVDYYINKLKFPTPPSPLQKNRILAFLREHADDNIITEHHCSKIAWIYWRVKK